MKAAANNVVPIVPAAIDDVNTPTCRGCSDDCRLRRICKGAPWRLSREQQDKLLGLS